jgi:deazaflavin-dependent oxidoreductase (nitroreductase family)
MPLSPDLAARLSSSRTIDLTTTGRKTGRPHRIEIWWFHVDGRFIITGSPGRRDWLANVRANPSVVIHAAGRDLPAKAIEVTDIEEKRKVFTRPDTSWYQTQAELERLVETAPMVEIDFI